VTSHGAGSYSSTAQRFVEAECLVLCSQQPATDPYRKPSQSTKNVFWDVTLWCSCKNRRFWGTYRFHHQGAENELARNVTSNSSERSVLTGATQRYIPEEDILHSHYRENLRSYTSVYSVLLNSLRSNLISSSQLLLVSLIAIFLLVFPTIILRAFFATLLAACPAQLILVDLARSTIYVAPRYTASSTLLSLPPFAVQIFSSAPFSNTLILWRMMSSGMLRLVVLVRTRRFGGT
jgi:hypothetical protein